MNRANLLKLLVTGFILTATAVGCKKAPVHPTPIPGVFRPVPGASKTGDPLSGGPGDTSLKGPTTTPPTSSNLTPDPTGSNPLTAREDRENFWVDRDTFKESTVYFDFDSSALKTAEKPKTDAVAEFLKANPTYKLELEGHCDERGTDEYNLALGERRALSVREYLISVGIARERVSTISYGEDKPAIQGQDETAYAKNRRGEFILLKPKTP